MAASTGPETPELSAMQEGMIFHSAYGEGPDVYIVQMVLHCRCRVSPRRLERALASLARAQPMLQCFVRAEAGGRPSLVRAEDVYPAVRSVLAQPEEDIDLVAETSLGEERSTGVDIFVAPLVRALVVLKGTESRVILTMHHLLLDGWSLGLIVDGLDRAYQGTELAPPTSDPQNLVLESMKGTREGSTYWERRLRQLRPLLLLPGRDPNCVTWPKMFSLDYPKGLIAGLKVLGRQENLRLASLLRWSWYCELGHITGRKNLTTGETVSTRSPALSGVETCVGQFIQTVPSGLDLGSGGTGLEIARVLQRSFDASVGRGVPSLAEQRHLCSLWPLNDTALTVENYPRTSQSHNPDGLNISFVGTHDWTHFSIAVVAATNEEGSLRLDYDPRIPKGDILAMGERMVDRLRAISAGAGKHVGPSGPLPMAPGADEVERPAQQPAGPVPGNRSVCDLFEDQVLVRPDAPAVRYLGQALSYAEVDRRANRLAGWMVQQGAGRDTIIAVGLPRSERLVVALLAVLKAGAVYMPIDPSLPVGRAAAMVADAKPQIALCDEASFRPWSTGTNVAWIAYDDNFEASLVGIPSETKRSAPDGVTELKPSDAAYLIYTSGSTGRPKGVLCTHGGLLDLVNWASSALMLDGDGTLGMMSSPSFDASICEIVAPLCSGAAVGVIPGFLSVSPLDWQEEWRRNEINCAIATAAGLDILRPVCATLRALVAAGETCSQATLRHFVGIGAKVSVAYGPTEATVCAAAREVGESADGPQVLGPPIRGVQAYVLDEQLGHAPVGSVGELFLSGVGLAREYLRQPGKTALRFLPNPYGPPGSRMYRTGDLAAWDERGNLVFHGRIDRQLKIRGNRVELGEIESVLSEHPDVRNVVVTVEKSMSGEDRLIGHVVTQRGTTDLNDVRQWVADRLPTYMCPNDYVPHTQLPLLVSGKVDTSGLVTSRNHDRIQSSTGDGITTFGQDVLGVISQVLSRRAELEDNFFRLGGTSLDAYMVVLSLQDRNIDCSPKDLFSSPRLSEFIELLHSRMQSSRPSPATGTTIDVLASPIERRIWLDQQCLSSAGPYTFAYAFSSNNKIGTSRLIEAVRSFLQLNPILLSKYYLADDGLRRVSNPAADAEEAISIVQLASSVGALQLISTLVTDGLDLAVRAPFAVTLVHDLAKEETLLLVQVHHIVSDAASIPIIAKGLETAYEEAGSPGWTALSPNRAKGAEQGLSSLLSADAPIDSVITLEEVGRRAEELSCSMQHGQRASLPDIGSAYESSDRATITIRSVSSAAIVSTLRDAGAQLLTGVHCLVGEALLEATRADYIASCAVLSRRHSSRTRREIGCFLDVALLLYTRRAGAPWESKIARQAASDAAGFRTVGYADDILHLVPAIRSRSGKMADIAFVPLDSGADSPHISMDGVELLQVDVPRAKGTFDLVIHYGWGKGDEIVVELETSPRVMGRLALQRLACRVHEMFEDAAGLAAGGAQHTAARQPEAAVLNEAADALGSSPGPERASRVDPAGSRAVAGADTTLSAARRAPVEVAALQVIRELIGSAPEAVAGSWFDMGGSSLDAARLAVAWQKLGLAVEVADVLQTRNILDLLRGLSDRPGGK